MVSRQSHEGKSRQTPMYCFFWIKQDNLCQINIGDNNILPEDDGKILRFHVDIKLNFNTQITNICHTAGRKVQSRCCHVPDQSSKILYNSFVEFYFNYCSVIWHFTSNNNKYIKLRRLKRLL